jgi:hypothetical protein
VSRLAAIEDMAGMAILCSDKTGTLTLNKMVIQPDTPVYVEGETQYSLLRYLTSLLTNFFCMSMIILIVYNIVMPLWQLSGTNLLAMP